MSETDELRATVEMLAARVRALEDHRSSDQATGGSYALHIRWDADAGRFWVARVSANTWRWVRTPQGWRITERINANLDGTAEHRNMLAPPAARRPPA
jgi:hypothetical protein